MVAVKILERMGFLFINRTQLSSLAWRLAQLLLLNLNYSVPEYSLPQGLYPRVISSERPVIFPWACYHYCLYLDF